MSQSYHARLPITSTAITLTFPLGVFFSTPPIIQLTIEGAPTDVDMTRNQEVLGVYGFVYTSVTFTFQAGAVGKNCNISVFAE